MHLDGAKKLLQEMNEPIISTHSQKESKRFVSHNEEYARTIEHLDSSYDGVQGWAMTKDELKVLADRMKV